MFARMFLFILSFLATSQYVVANVPRKPDITITFGNLTLSLGAVDTKGNSLSLKDVQLHADTLSMIGDSLSQKQRINNVYEYVEYPELVNSINESVNPCEDFYEFVCQGWQNKQTIEPYENVISQFRLARDEVFLRLKKILSEQREKDRVDDLFYIVYEKCMDKNAQNSLRSKPLLNMLRKLQDVHPEYLTDWLIEVSPVTVFVTFSVETDQMNSTRNTLELNMVKAEMLHDYFIDEKYRDRVEAFKDYLWQIMQLLIDDDPNQEFFSKNAEAVNRSIDSFVDVETQMSLILNESDPHADDHEAFYNLYGFDELQAVMPAINLTKLFIAIAPKELLDKIDLKNLTVVVPEPDSLKSLDSLIQAMSASNLRNYLRWKLILAYVPFLDERFEDVQLKFDTVMYGIVNKEPRWMQCVRVSINFLTDIANALYVKEYVPPNSLADLRILMDNVRYSFENLLKENEWMDNETKGRALLKVKELVAFIAYDEKSITKEALEKKYTLLRYNRSMSAFDIAWTIFRWKDDYNLLSLLKINNRKTAAFASPYVNAYYYSLRNQMVVLSGILQRPFYGIDLPPAFNYGSIGMVIGHEITHGFDSTGRQYNEVGSNVMWWENSTLEAFLQLKECFIKQYNQIEVPGTNGMHIDGEKTQTENIADNGGIRASYAAMQRSLAQPNGRTKRIAGLEQYNDDQLFFIGYAYTWCSKTRPENVVNELLADPHSPDRFRVNVVLGNFEKFAEAFNCPVNPNVTSCRVW